MKRIYLSHFLGPDSPFYGGDGTFHVESLRSMEAGDSCNACRWSFPNHAGTHIDLPYHFSQEGKRLHDYPADFWLFQHIAVIEIPDVQPGATVWPDQLDQCQADTAADLVLLKTGFGRFRKAPVYWQEGPVLRPELAEYLRGRFPYLRAIGFDSISLSSWKDRAIGREAHRTFLSGERPLLLIEDMDLTNIEAISYINSVIAVPLLVHGADAAPCTVIAEVCEP